MYKISFTFLFDRDNICIFFFQQEIGYTQACVKQTLLFKDFYKLNTSKRFFGCNFHICLSCFFFFLNQIMRLSSARKSFFFQYLANTENRIIVETDDIYIRYRLYIMISRPLLELQRFCTSPIRTSLWSLGPSIDLHNILDCLKIIALAKDNK